MLYVFFFYIFESQFADAGIYTVCMGVCSVDLSYSVGAKIIRANL